MMQPPGSDPTADTMDYFNQMQGSPDMPIIEDEAAMLVDSDSPNFHALDVPDTWRDANPFAMDAGVAFGTGYPDIASAGMGAEMPMGAGPAGGGGALDIKAMRDALYGEMSAKQGRDKQFQQQSMDENQQLTRAARRK